MKVGCKARMTISKPPGALHVDIIGDLQHQNHNPTSAQSISESRLSPRLHQFIEKWIQEGENWLQVSQRLQLGSAILERVCTHVCPLPFPHLLHLYQLVLMYLSLLLKAHRFQKFSVCAGKMCSTACERLCWHQVVLRLMERKASQSGLLSLETMAMLSASKSSLLSRTTFTLSLPWLLHGRKEYVPSCHKFSLASCHEFNLS